MSKSPKKTDVYELVKSIDAELSAREETCQSNEDALQELQNSFAQEKVAFEEEKTAFEKDKAEFAVRASEVEQKFNKIRNDIQLSEDLRAQAIQAKAIEENLKEAKEEHGLAVLTLKEIEKREQAVSLRETNYKEELKKEFASNLFKG
jgi:hypothetical protein